MNDSLIDRVRQIMRNSGLTQRDFAARIATTPDKLSKSLAGQRKLTTTELALIAEAANTTVDWLLTGQQAPAPFIAARTGLTTTPSSVEITAVVEKFSAASDQLALLSEQPRLLPGLPTIARTGRYVDEGNELARYATMKVADHGYDLVAERDLSIVLEKVFSLDIAIQPLPGSLDGCSWQTENTRLVVLAPSPNWARQRFTLAHELGHILAKDAQELIAESVPPHSDSPSEKRANAFAAGFLMPEERVRAAIEGEVTEELFGQLVNEFRVSPSSMAWRLYNLELLDSDRVRQLGNQTAEFYALSHGRADLLTRERTRAQAQRMPSRLMNEHLRLYFSGQTSARPLAALLGISTSEVRELLGSGQAERI